MQLKKFLLLSLIFFLGWIQLNIHAQAHPLANNLGIEQKPEVEIAVLAFRSHTATQKRWQPLIEYLNQEIPEYHFKLSTFYEFELAKSKHPNFIFTNPRHFIEIKQPLEAPHMVNPLATLTSIDAGFPTNELGGVIFTKHDRDDINTLSDLKTASIASAFKSSLGGFIAQIHELLEANVNIDIKNIKYTGMPHDNVVHKVLRGEADAGFVRTGVLESMRDEGVLDFNQIKIINQQNLPLFPFITSTALYPEWVFAACSENHPILNKQVAKALFKIEPEDKVALETNIYGFSLPKSYKKLEQTLIKLGFINPINWDLVYHSHIKYLAISLLIAGIFLLAIISFLLFNRQRLKQTIEERNRLNLELTKTNSNLKTLVNERTEELQLDNLKFKSMFNGHSSPMMLIDPNTGKIHDINKAALSFYGYSEDKITQMNIFEINMIDKDQVAIERRKAIREERNYFIFPHKLASGEIRYVEVHSSPVNIDNKQLLFSIIHDITKRVKAQERLQLHDAALNYAANAIVITDNKWIITWANKAYGDLTGYLPSQYIGESLNEITITTQADRDLFKQVQKIVLNGEKWQGVLPQTDKNGNSYQAEITVAPVRNDKYEITNFIAVMQDVTKRIEAEQQIQNLAFYDSLTKLPNRKLLVDRLNNYMEYTAQTQKHGALIYMDLDHFKTLNDAYGHNIGDKLLFKISKRLKRTLDSLTTISRFGGDEFVILLTDLNTDPIEAGHQAIEQAQKIKNALGAKPFYLELDEQGTILEHKISASMGVTVFQGVTRSSDDILKWAEMAMYHAKASGRNEIRLFDPKMQTALDTRIRLEQELSLAIDNGELELHYQPQIDANQRILGAEALIRWLHPEHGLIPPIEFIPVAEESGLIVALGEWVLETAIKQIKEWSTDEDLCQVQISINISAKQLYQVNFENQVKELINQYQINPLMLKLEITESALLNHKEASIKKMNALREIGIQFSMDDFGTGYSSLSYLKQLPFSQIKIDQSFVQDLGVDHTDEMMVQTIMNIGNSFEMSVVAEGVETQEQFQILQSYNCKLFQGYFFSKPLPLADFVTKVKEA